MTEGARVPKLRFKGFNAPWDSMLLSDISKSVYGGGTPDTSNPSYWNGDIPWIQSSDIIENSPFYVKINKYVTNTGISSSATKFIPSNSLAVVTRVGVGKLAAVRFSYATSQDFVSLSSLSTDLDFTAIALQKKLQDELNVVQGTSIKGITKNELLLKRIFIPKLEEQEKIGNLLKVLYKLIDQQQQKHQKMVELKQAMLEKMFPREGETVPELRFPGFTDPWTTIASEKIFTSVSEKGYPSLPVLSATQDRGMVKREDNNLSIFHNTENEAGYKRVLPGQFVIHLRSFQGGFAHSSVTGITSPAYTVLRFKNPDNQNDSFWKHIFKSKTFIQRLDTVTYGIRDGRSISYDEFLSMHFTIPNHVEQRAIAFFLDTLDDRIAKMSRRVDKLKQLKQALLEKMFV